jgi:hypothetical protein
MTGPFGPDDAGQPQAGRDLRWPAGLSPGFSDVWACSEVVVLAASEVVFTRLVNVSGWERDFSGIRKVRTPAPGRGYLEMDSEFEFELAGLLLCARVSEFAPSGRLAWSGQGIDISAYHGWVVSGDSGRSRVLAGFAARGAAAVALREADPLSAQRTLDRWVTDLKAVAERSATPTAS